MVHSFRGAVLLDGVNLASVPLDILRLVCLCYHCTVWILNETRNHLRMQQNLIVVFDLKVVMPPLVEQCNCIVNLRLPNILFTIKVSLILPSVSQTIQFFAPIFASLVGSTNWYSTVFF